MEMHCAPMRDAMMVKMVKMIMDPEESTDADATRKPVKVLWMWFEILEVMKLEQFDKGVMSLNITRRWISRAAGSIPPSFPPSRSKLVMTTPCKVMVDLAIDPPAPATGSTPPSFKPVQACFVKSSTGCDMGYPETLYLDYQPTTVSASSGVEDWEIDRVKWEGKREKGMGDVVLQVAKRVEEDQERVKRGEKVVKEGEDEILRRPPSADLLALIENWQRTDYKKDSPLQKIMKQRLQTAVLDVVKEHALEGALKTSVVGRPGMSMCKKHGSGLEPLMPEIMHLGKRIARLVVFHAKVYRRLYEMEEFVDTEL
ncbi:hypothetical protein FRB99_003298 [Tulasnella sp. 403]|nr:hypothetical protein FRB99_003298 [Tulasnella sp. 403]